MAKKGKGTVAIRILGDADQFRRTLKGSERDLDTFGSKVTRRLRSVGRVIATFAKAGAVALGVFLGASVKKATDLNETLSKTEVVFKGAARSVITASDEMAAKFGVVKQVFLDGASNIGLVAKASGLTEEAAASMGVQFAKAAADASSFFNVPFEEALEKIRSGLVGEAEPLRSFGVLLSAAAVEEEALALGIAKTGDKLTEQQKVLARSSLITKGLTDASGDLERTQDSLANRFRTLKGRAENFAASVGQKLIPHVERAWDAMDRLVGAFQAGLRGEVSTEGGLFGAVARLGGLAADARDRAIAAWDDLKGWWEQNSEAIGDRVRGAFDVVSSLASSVAEDAKALVGSIADGIREGDWEKVGKTLGGALLDGLRGAGDLSRRFGSWVGEQFEKVDWVGLGISLGKAAVPLALGLVTGLLNFDMVGLLRGVATHWFEILMGAIAIAFIPAKFIGTIGRALARIPFAGRFLKWGLEAVHGFGRAILRGIGQVFRWFGRGFREALDLGAPRWIGDFVARLQLLPDYLVQWRGFLVEKAQAAIVGFGRAIGRGARNVVDELNRIRSEIFASVRHAGRWLWEAGKDLIRGLWNGIKSTGSWIKRNVEKFIDDHVPGPIKKLLRLSSPSRLFFAFGQDTIEGYIRGLADKSSDLRATIEGVFRDALGGVSSVLGGFGAMSGRRGAQRSLRAARGDLQAALSRQQELPGLVSAAERDLMRAQADAAKVTLDEELRLLDAREAVRRAEEALTEAREDADATADGLRRKELELARAQRDLAQAEEDAVGPTREVTEAEGKLRELLEEQEAITRRVEEAREALTDAELAAIEAEQRLFEAGQELVGLGPVAEEFFRMLAGKAGLTSDAIDTLIQRWKDLAAAQEAATRPVAGQVGAIFRTPASLGGDPRSGQAGDAAFDTLKSAMRRVRDIFTNRDVTIAAGGESEQQRLRRVAGEVLSGKRGGTLEEAFESVRRSVDWIKANAAFDSGGIIPGPRGKPRLVLGHGGETMVPTHRQGFTFGADDRVVHQLAQLRREIAALANRPIVLDGRLVARGAGRYLPAEIESGGAR